jgi:hypothetical protein
MHPDAIGIQVACYVVEIRHTEVGIVHVSDQLVFRANPGPPIQDQEALVVPRHDFIQMEGLIQFILLAPQQDQVSDPAIQMFPTLSPSMTAASTRIFKSSFFPFVELMNFSGQ